MNPIILGLWPIAGITSVGVTREHSLATIQTAIDAGIDMFDTAFSYGFEGESDQLLGEVLRREQNRGRHLMVIGKVGQRWTSDRRRVVNGSPEQLIADTEVSLSRIGIERFDLLMLHSVDPDVDVEYSASGMEQLRRRGLARRIGICNASCDQLIRFSDVALCTAMQCPLNLLQQNSLDPLIRTASSIGAEVHAYWALMKGLLAGQIDRNHVFADGDSRPKYDIFQGEARQHAHDVVDRLSMIADKYDMTIAKLAIGWVLSQLGVTAVLVGAKRPDQILETSQSRRLPQSILSEVNDALNR